MNNCGRAIKTVSFFGWVGGGLFPIPDPRWSTVPSSRPAKDFTPTVRLGLQAPGLTADGCPSEKRDLWRCLHTEACSQDHSVIVGWLQSIESAAIHTPPTPLASHKDSCYAWTVSHHATACLTTSARAPVKGRGGEGGDAVSHAVSTLQ